MKSKKYDTLKSYYLAGLWTKKMLSDAVKKGWITADEYDEITGGDHAEGTA